MRRLFSDRDELAARRRRRRRERTQPDQPTKETEMAEDGATEDGDVTTSHTESTTTEDNVHVATPEVAPDESKDAPEPPPEPEPGPYDELSERTQNREGSGGDTDADEGKGQDA